MARQKHRTRLRTTLANHAVDIPMSSYCVFQLQGDKISILAKGNSVFDLDQLIKLFSLPKEQIIHHGYYIKDLKHQIYVAKDGYLQGRTDTFESGFLAMHNEKCYAIMQYDYPILAPEAGAALLQKMTQFGVR